MPEEGELSALEASCSPGTLDACPASGKLVFSLSDKRASGFLSAYADPIGHDAERVFYYSKQDGSPKLPNETAARPLGSMKPGRYRVHAVIADRPLTREELVELAPGRVAGTEIRAKVKVELVVGE